MPTVMKITKGGIDLILWVITLADLMLLFTILSMLVLPTRGLRTRTLKKTKPSNRNVPLEQTESEKLWDGLLFRTEKDAAKFANDFDLIINASKDVVGMPALIKNQINKK